MDMVQTDVSNPALVAAIRANLCGFFHYLGRSLPENFLENEKFARWRTPIAHPWFNGALSSLPPEESDTGFIEDCILYFRTHNVSRFTWWTEPHVKCTDWKAILTRHGFEFANDTPGMALDLQALDGAAQTVSGLEIRAVDDEEALQTWSHIFTRGYGLPPAWEPSVYELEQRLGLDLPVRNFLGYWNGVAVATSSLFIGRGVAGIYNVSTLPEARGEGIGAALTLRPLQDARELGYRIGVLQSSEMGFNIYQKLGFRHLCQIEYFSLATA
jgi:ribosomal protein S18 acetylase RimI-like enzyme